MTSTLCEESIDRALIPTGGPDGRILLSGTDGLFLLQPLEWTDDDDELGRSTAVVVGWTWSSCSILLGLIFLFS